MLFFFGGGGGWPKSNQTAAISQHHYHSKMNHMSNYANFILKVYQRCIYYILPDVIYNLLVLWEVENNNML